MSAAETKFSTVVMGGSAGAIEVLMALLPELPASLRACILIVLHLPREKPSLLVDIFAPRCALAVREAQHNEPLMPGSITFAPPDYHLLVDRGPRTCLSVDEPVHYSRPSIDVLFESAADALGARLIGVLLSGANADGAKGLAAIAREGGLTLVQTPGSAQAPAMPQAALKQVATPDFVSPPKELAGFLVDLHTQRLL